MAKKQIYDLCKVYLFEDEKAFSSLNTVQIDRIKRIRSAYTFWNDYPNKKVIEVVNHIRAFSGVEKNQAYDDIHIIQQLLGDLNKQTKDWHRFKFNTMVMKAYELAELKQDPDAMQKAANTYAKFNQLDKEDAQRIAWEDLVPQLFEPTEDPSVLGIKPIPNVKQRIADLHKKYAADIEDVSYENIDIEQLKKYEDK